MSTKELALKTIRELPENAEWEVIRERIAFVSGVEEGLAELNEGRGLSLDAVKQEIKEWIAK